MNVGIKRREAAPLNLIRDYISNIFDGLENGVKDATTGAVTSLKDILSGVSNTNKREAAPLDLGPTLKDVGKDVDDAGKLIKDAGKTVGGLGLGLGGGGFGIKERGLLGGVDQTLKDAGKDVNDAGKLVKDVGETGGAAAAAAAAAIAAAGGAGGPGKRDDLTDEAVAFLKNGGQAAYKFVGSTVESISEGLPNLHDYVKSIENQGM